VVTLIQSSKSERERERERGKDEKRVGNGESWKGCLAVSPLSESQVEMTDCRKG